MKSAFLCAAILFPGLLIAKELTRLEVVPYDFQNELAGFDDFYLKSINQIEAVGEKLVMRSRSERIILVLDTETGEKQVVGSSGDGPGEFSHGVAAMGVKGDQIWAISSGHLDRLMNFRNGEFVSSRIIHTSPLLGRGFVNALACSGDSVVVPASPSTKHLGMIYDTSGKARGIGNLVFYRLEDRELLTRIPAINHTTWLFARDHWYAVFNYLPQIQVFDKGGTLVDTFSLEHPSIADAYGKVLDFDPKKARSHPGPLIEDMKFFRGNLYVMASGILFRLDGETGTIHSAHRFFASGKNAGRPEDDTRKMNFQHFAFTADGNLYLSHPVALNLWDHDLFMIKAPSFLNKKNP